MPKPRRLTFSLSSLLIGKRRFSSLESRTRARILVNVVALTYPMPIVNAALVFAQAGSFPLLSLAAALVLSLVLLGVWSGANVAALAYCYSFAMELAFIEAAVLMGSHVALVGLFFVPFASVLILGRARSALLLLFPAAFFLGARRLLSALGFSSWSRFDLVEGYQASESVSFLISLGLVYAAGCALERLALNLYRAYLREKAAAQREIAARTAKEEELESLLDANRGALTLLGHDLRNPIGSFRALVHSIRADECIDPAEYRTVLSEMEKSLDSIWRLLDELLDWARAEDGFSHFEPEDSPVLPVAEGAVDTVKDLFRSKDVSVSLRIPEDLAAWADPRMLAAILRNLVANAVKFTPRGGSVSIAAERVGARPGAASGVRLTVSDTGIGIPPSILKSMADTGAAGQRRGTEGEPGTGLGLALCRRLVGRHGGSLGIESAEGHGSSFTVFLPFRKTD